MKIGEKVYLGDGVYAEWDGEFIILTTGPNNTIYLDVVTLNNLKKFEESLDAKR